MWDFWSRLFDSSGFPARWQCGSWSPGHGWLHVLSDVGIWAAYFVIPCVLGYYTVRRRGIPFRGVLVLFVAFILSCGLTHLMEAAIFWWPAYRLAGVLKLLTAVVSWVTVFALLRVTPRVLAFRSPAELEAEIAERHRAEGDLRSLQAQLEDRVRRRTADLEGAVAALEAEVEERKGVERQLRESREQLRLVADNAPLMLVHCDGDRRYRFVNRAYAESNGVSPADVLGKTIPEVVGERTYELLRANVDTALAGGRADDEVESPYAGAGKRWLRHTFVPHRSDAGAVEGFLVVIVDVTERRNAEELLRTITDTVPALIAYVDREGRYRLNNRAYEQWFGHARSDLAGRHMRDVLGEAAWAVVEPRFGTALAGRAVRYEAEVPYKDGGVRWIDATYTPHLDAGGELDGVVSLVNDVTERHGAETALRRSEGLFRQLANAMPQIVWMTGAGGHVDYQNDRWYEYTGQPRSGGGDASWTLILHPDDSRPTFDAWAAAVRSGRNLEIEHRFRNGTTGEYRWHISRATSVRDEAGGIVRWFGTSTDIHDTKLAEEELRELNARLEERVTDSLRERLDERRRAEEALFGTRSQLLDAIESLDAGFVMYGPDERMVVCNTKYKEIYAACAHTMVPGTPYEEVLRAFVGAGAVSHTGLSEEEWVGRRLHAHRHPGEPVEQWLAGRWIRISDRLTSNGGVVSLRTDITALKHAQQAAEERALALARSERTLRHQTDILTSILDSMGDAVIVADRDGKFLVFNPAAERMLGTGSTAATPDQWPDLYRIYLPDGETPAPASSLPLVRAMRGEETNDVEMVLRPRHGPERAFVTASGRPLRGGGDGGGVVVIRDVTARKRAEASLKESEERFRRAFDFALIGMALVAPGGRWLQVNRSLCDLVGRTERELLATDFQAITHPDDLAADLGHVRQLLDGTAQTYQLEKRYFHKLGHVVHVLLSASLVRDGSGRPLYFVAQIKDVTRQKADEKALAANEELLRQFIKHSPAAIAMFDRDMSYIQTSDRWLADYHLAGRDVIGARHYEVFTGVPERWRAGHRRVLAGGVERCEEDRIERADGSAEWLQWECRPWRDAEGEVGGVIMFTQVITQRKVVEERVKASLREKEVLLKEIHHRVKNNLQIVSTLLDLQSGHTTDRAAVEMFKESRGRVKSMALIHERLYRSQDMARVDLAEYVRQLAGDLHRTYRVSEGIRLELDVDVPPLPIDIAIPCGLLLNELISNCFKHAFADATEGCLRVALHRDGGANVLTVADDGAGFPAGTDFQNTTSFGLQLVNTLVDQLDGEIALATDRGTTFTVRFPKTAGHPAGTRT